MKSLCWRRRDEKHNPFADNLIGKVFAESFYFRLEKEIVSVVVEEINQNKLM